MLLILKSFGATADLTKYHSGTLACWSLWATACFCSMGNAPVNQYLTTALAYFHISHKMKSFRSNTYYTSLHTTPTTHEVLSGKVVRPPT